MQESPGVALKLANTIEDLEVVGAVLAGVAEAAGLDALARNDLQTAAMEACKNVVWHAYEGLQGPLELEIGLAAGAVEVTVRDHGIGIRPHLGERTQPHTGIGMPIAHLLTRRITYTNMPGGGTEVLMEFAMPSVAEPGACLDPGVLELLAQEDDEDSILLALCGEALIRAVLPLALAALAQRAGMAPTAVGETGQLAAAALAAATGGEEDPGSLVLRARLESQGIDLGFSRLGRPLERELRDRARRGQGGPALVITEGEGRRPGEGLLLRLRPAG